MMHMIKILIFYCHTEVHKTKFSIKNILTEQRENRLPKKYDQGVVIFFTGCSLPKTAPTGE